MAERTNINTIVDLNNKNNYNVFLPLYIPDSDDEQELEERKTQGKVRKKIFKLKLKLVLNKIVIWIIMRMDGRM